MILLSSDVADLTLEEAIKEPGLLKTYWNNAVPNIITIGVKVILAVLILFVGSKIIKAVLKGIKKSLDKSKIERGVKSFLLSMIKYVLYFLLFMLILSQFGITASSVVAILGSAGLTLGLALQGSLSNFAGGVLILLLKPFVVGDYILEKSTGLEGTVSDISIFYTKLITVDNKEVSIPNGNLSNTSVINYTKFEKRRVDIKVSVSYDTDLKLARKVLEKTAEDCTYRLENEPVDIFVDELAESSVNLGLRVWVSSADYWNAKWELTESVKEELDANSISIPFPQLDIHTK